MTVKQLARRYGRSEQTIRNAIKRGAIPDAYYVEGKRGTYIIKGGEMPYYYYGNDPVRDAERYSADQEEQLERYPVCFFCGNHCTGDTAYLIQDKWMCEDCKDDYKVYLEDYLEDNYPEDRE